MRINDVQPCTAGSWNQYTAYSLRHSWAISSIKRGTNIRLAARSLGHTVSEHESTYLTWITEKEMEDAMLAEAG